MLLQIFDDLNKSIEYKIVINASFSFLQWLASRNRSYYCLRYMIKKTVFFFVKWQSEKDVKKDFILEHNSGAGEGGERRGKGEGGTCQPLVWPMTALAGLATDQLRTEQSSGPPQLRHIHGTYQTSRIMWNSNVIPIKGNNRGFSIKLLFVLHILIASWI